MIVWLASYPRSGNTLIRLILKQAFNIHTYSQYNDTNDIGSDPEMSNAVGHVSFEGNWESFYKDIKKTDDLYVVKTHDYPPDDGKAIYIIRDGRSSIVSYRHYTENYSGVKLSLSDAILGGFPFGGWSDHVTAWQPQTRKNTLLLRFEDVLENTRKAVEDIAGFLGREIGGAVNTDFSHLHSQFPTFFRSGSDRKNNRELNKAHIALFDLLHGDTMTACGYERGQPAPSSHEVLLPVLGEWQESLRSWVAQRHQLARLAIEKLKLEERLNAKNKDLAQSTALAESRLRQRQDLERESSQTQKQMSRALAAANILAEDHLNRAIRLEREHAEASGLAENRLNRISMLEKESAEARALAEDQLGRITLLEKGNAELRKSGKENEAELESRQQSIAQLRKQYDATLKELAGNPFVLLRARNRARKILKEQTIQPPLALTGTSGQGVKTISATSTAKWASLVPEDRRSMPAQPALEEGDLDFGIALFGFNRPHFIENSLTSLGHQRVLGRVHVFIDGDQGRPHLRALTDEVANVAARFPVCAIHRRAGNLGFRKMMLQSMTTMSERYDKILFLEDDCFPTRNCFKVFRSELNSMADRDDVFSVYGHPFGLPNEGDYFTRFQGWGWGTTSRKLKPLLADLVRCYWMDETEFLEFTRAAMTEEVLQTIDVTPGRQPSVTLKRFFAWDETICLLAALRGMKHKRTSTRVIYNCGAGAEGSHFTKIEYYRKPPFNMVAADEVWEYF